MVWECPPDGQYLAYLVADHVLLSQDAKVTHVRRIDEPSLDQDRTA